MTDTHVEATFDVTSWDESPFDDDDGSARLTEAVVSKKYAGAIEGSSLTKWLMAYAPDKTATFTGIERIRGSVAGRRGAGAGTFRADPAGAVTLDLDL